MDNYVHIIEVIQGQSRVFKKTSKLHLLSKVLGSILQLKPTLQH